VILGACREEVFAPVSSLARNTRFPGQIRTFSERPTTSLFCAPVGEEERIEPNRSVKHSHQRILINLHPLRQGISKLFF
jgi:hypothetical protein